MDIISEGIVTAPEAKEILGKRDMENMSYEQKICIDFLKKNVKMSAEDARNMLADLKEVNVPEDLAHCIVNTLPRNTEEIKSIFPRERLAPSSEDLEKIDEIVRKYE